MFGNHAPIVQIGFGLSKNPFYFAFGVKCWGVNNDYLKRCTKGHAPVGEGRRASG